MDVLWSTKRDPRERQPRYRRIIKAAERQAALNVGEMADCHRRWIEQQRILIEVYGIDWQSPADLNPHICFD